MHFTFKELIESEVSRKYGYDNYPKQHSVITNLYRIVIDVLEPLRKWIDKPIIVTSGYRSPLLNSCKEINGAIDSQHIFGEAVDIWCNTLTPFELHLKIKYLNLPYDQMIIYHDKLHISLKKMNNRKQVLDYRT